MHIPLQAGTDEILKSMNRKYDTKYFKEKIAKIIKIRPDISITTDVITGFPGETEELFDDGYKFIEEIGFTKLHVFPYSRRKGTKADLMLNQIDERIKKERVNKLINLSNQLECKYLEKFIDKIVEVLIETNSDNISSGHTGNYLMVKINKNIKSNSLVKVKINKLVENYLEGELYEEN